MLKAGFDSDCVSVYLDSQDTNNTGFILSLLPRWKKKTKTKKNWGAEEEQTHNREEPVSLVCSEAQSQ